MLVKMEMKGQTNERRRFGKKTGDEKKTEWVKKKGRESRDKVVRCLCV